MIDNNKQKERLINLRAQLRHAMDFENAHETWSDIMIKLLNTAHNISIKANQEVTRLQSQLDKALGTLETADILSDMIVNTLDAHNRQEEARKAAEELKKQGLDGPSVGDLEVEQREKEAEEIAKQETAQKEEKENLPPQTVTKKVPEEVKKAVKQRRPIKNTVRRRRK